MADPVGRDPVGRDPVATELGEPDRPSRTLQTSDGDHEDLSVISVAAVGLRS